MSTLTKGIGQISYRHARAVVQAGIAAAIVAGGILKTAAVAAAPVKVAGDGFAAHCHFIGFGYTRDR